MQYLLDPGIVLTPVMAAPSPATTGTTLTVGAGDGALLGDRQAAWVYPAGAMYGVDPLAAEQVEVTGVAGDVLTVVRAQGGTAARTILAGDALYTQLRGPRPLLVSSNIPTFVKVPIVAGVNTGGGLFAWQNLSSGALIVRRVLLNITTVSASACSVDIGTTATSAVTAADNLMDGTDIHAAVGTFDFESQTGANGKTAQLLPVGSWVTGTAQSGDSTGAVGAVYLETIPA